MNEAHAVLELRLLVLLGRVERALEVVEHRQQLVHEPLRGARGQLALLARRALAVVVELRLEALERVEVLVALPRHVCERIDLGGRLLAGSFGRLLLLGYLRFVGHDRVAPSSSSITS